MRRRGFATSFGEWQRGHERGGRPGRGRPGTARCRDRVWGPAFRVQPARVAEIVTSSREAAAGVTARLGEPQPDVP